MTITAVRATLSTTIQITSSDNCTWFDGKYAVICRSDGKTPMGPSKSLGFIGYSTEEKVYTYYAVDNSNMAMASVPKGTVKGDTWTYNDEGMMGGKKMKSRVTIKELSPTSYTFSLEMQGPDGKWMPFMESKATKAAPTTNRVARLPKTAARLQRRAPTAATDTSFAGTLPPSTFSMMIRLPARVRTDVFTRVS